MATAEMLRPYVEQKIAAELGLERVTLDSDGDIPIKSGSAVYYARLFDGSGGPVFRMFSPILLDVPMSGPLLERLNELNQRAQYVRFLWQSDQVVCSMDLPADNLAPGDIRIAMSEMSWNADHWDDELKAAFGGRRMLEDETPPKPENQTATAPDTAAADTAAPASGGTGTTGESDTAYL